MLAAFRLADLHKTERGMSWEEGEKMDEARKLSPGRRIGGEGGERNEKAAASQGPSRLSFAREKGRNQTCRGQQQPGNGLTLGI